MASATVSAPLAADLPTAGVASERLLDALAEISDDGGGDQLAASLLVWETQVDKLTQGRACSARKAMALAFEPTLVSPLQGMKLGL